MSVKGKKLLVLGGSSATLDLVKNAKEMGVYTIVTDDNPNSVTKKIADEAALVSTVDMEGLEKLIEETKVDGVFCGPSEFNIRNLIALCEKTGLPCYTDMKTWDLCANKDIFKNYCRKYDVDCTPEYDIKEDTTDEELEKIEYPIIIKPVDGCSSAGISVCNDKSEVRPAYKKAMDASKCKRIIAEKFIENDGEIFCVRYLLKDGEAYPYFLMDTYVADPVTRKSLISALAYAPSKYHEYYMKNMDQNVRKMLKGMGLKNGTAFIQSLPCDGKIYFHEMGYRLSGGMIFKLTTPLVGVNDMKMMIRCALGEEMFAVDEVENIDTRCNGKAGVQFMIPLNAGKIGKIEGLEEAKAVKGVTDFIQYYNEGDTVEERFIGTLAQHFGRFTIIADGEKEIFESISKIQTILNVIDVDGNIMNQMKFDINRALN